MRTIDDVLRSVQSPHCPRLPAPPYEPPPAVPYRPDVGLAVKSMERHTTDEGWQLFQGLSEAGYSLCGRDVVTLFDRRIRESADERIDDVIAYRDFTDVRQILVHGRPRTLVLQDKREWEGRTAGPGFDSAERFKNVEFLKGRRDVFKLTVLKDAQHNPTYHRQSAEEIDCHAWVVYYHPRIITHLAPFVRPEHLVRTWHTIDKDLVPEYVPEGRGGCLVSGALSSAYPLRMNLVANRHILPHTDYLPHPGYHRRGCATPEYLKTLSRYRVAVCTSSVYGYALRKIVEATACGCVVISDLPADDELPGIDGNVYRVSSDVGVSYIAELIRRMIEDYSPQQQKKYADRAKAFYDYRIEGRRLADEIECLRRAYNGSSNG